MRGTRSCRGCAPHVPAMSYLRRPAPTLKTTEGSDNMACASTMPASVSFSPSGA